VSEALDVHAAALAAIPKLVGRRLLDLLAAKAPAEAWQAVVEGRGHDEPAIAALMAREAEAVDLEQLAAEYATAAVSVVAIGQPGYPAALAADHQAPAVLFHRGSLGALDGPRVAIIGTRRCTHYGRQVATNLGRALAEAGVIVVSGLALGVDGAAHTGALAAWSTPVVGVVGSGLDVVYPPRHARLWTNVGVQGALLSEAPLGAAPEPWRFPLRNRIIAALADAVVVVESHIAGGSNHTVAAAIDRSVPVMAVPGPITSSASAGTNRLLAEGCPPVNDVDDILVAIGLAGRPEKSRVATDHRPLPDAAGAAVLAAVGWSPSNLEAVTLRCGLAPAAVAVALNRLEAGGWIRCTEGWWERLASPQ
jgi:DNA processing protein